MEGHQQEGARQDVGTLMLSGLDDGVGSLAGSRDLLKHAASGVNHKHQGWGLAHTEQSACGFNSYFSSFYSSSNSANSFKFNSIQFISFYCIQYNSIRSD